MRKLSRVGRSRAFAGPIFFILLIIWFSQPALAHHRSQVLGEATPSSELVVPPVTSGPGFILPDSPLFFLDRFSQTVKLFFAFSSEARARVRAQIAGERLAELRIMLARQNPEGINVALTQLTKEVGLGAKDLSDAAAQGKDVRVLAKQLNEEIKFQRKLLNLVADQTRGVLRLQLKAARQALKESKVEVEDELPEDELEKEIEENLEDEIENEVEEASESAAKIERDILKLQEESGKAATKALNRRQEAIKKAIEERNEALRKAEEKLLEAEKKKQEALITAQKRAAAEAKEAIKKAAEAAKGFRTAKDKLNEIKNQPVGGTSGTSGNTTSNVSNPSSTPEPEEEED